MENEEDVRPAFVKWAEENSVDMTYREDWIEWWKCWCNGYDQCVKDIKGI